jgi:hypothetical protein
VKRPVLCLCSVAPLDGECDCKVPAWARDGYDVEQVQAAQAYVTKVTRS